MIRCERMKTTEAALRNIGLCYLDKHIGLGDRRPEVLADGAVFRIEIFHYPYFDSKRVLHGFPCPCASCCHRSDTGAVAAHHGSRSTRLRGAPWRTKTATGRLGLIK